MITMPCVTHFRRSHSRTWPYYSGDLNVDASYIRDVSRWISRLQSVVERWKGAWNCGAEPPRLDFVGTPTGGYVLDSSQRYE